MAVTFEWHLKGPGVSSREIDREKIRARLLSVIIQAARQYLQTSRTWNDKLVPLTGLDEDLSIRVQHDSVNGLSFMCSFYNDREESAEFIEQFLSDSIVDFHRLSWAMEPRPADWVAADPSNYLEWLISRLEDHRGGIDLMWFELSSPHVRQRFEFDRNRIVRLSANLKWMANMWTDVPQYDIENTISVSPSNPLRAFFTAISKDRRLELKGRHQGADNNLIESPINKLRSVASSGEEAFQDAVDAIESEALTAEELKEAVQLAIEAGALLLARNLAAQGAALHSENADLKKLATILRAPEFSSTPRKGDPSIRANNAWLREHAHDYRGEWVAIRNGELIAHGLTPKEIRDQIGDLSNALITKIAA